MQIQLLGGVPAVPCRSGSALRQGREMRSGRPSKSEDLTTVRVGGRNAGSRSSIIIHPRGCSPPVAWPRSGGRFANGELHESPPGVKTSYILVWREPECALTAGGAHATD